MLFLLTKTGLCIWISAYPFAENNFFGNLPQLWWIWSFAHMYLTRLRTRIWTLESHIYVQKWFFWPPKHCCTSRAQWKKTFSSTLNLMISQTVRNGCLRFGGHVGIQVSYKILGLEVLKDSPFWSPHLVFNRGWFEAVLTKNTSRTLGVNKYEDLIFISNIHRDPIV
jgi:hypothetical protein